MNCIFYLCLRSLLAMCVWLFLVFSKYDYHYVVDLQHPNFSYARQKMTRSSEPTAFIGLHAYGRGHL